MKLLIDTNVFLRFVEVDSPEFETCDKALEALRASEHTAYSCAQVLIEFWWVATRPRDVNGLDMSPSDTEREIEDIKSVYECLPELPDMAERWQRIAAAHDVRGRQTHDARLVALMLAHNVTHLLTLNPSDFSRYPEVTPVTPQDILTQPDG